jgi:hypothetical protein
MSSGRVSSSCSTSDTCRVKLVKNPVVPDLSIQFGAVQILVYNYRFYCNNTNVGISFSAQEPFLY